MVRGVVAGALVPVSVAAAMWKTHRQTQRQIRLQTARLEADAYVRRAQARQAVTDRGTERIDCLEIWWRLPARVPAHERGDVS